MRATKRRTTIDEVAELAGVSIKTVSRVFNNEPNVRPKTRAKVLESARELNYRPNVSARRLAANRSFVIGLLYDNPQSDYVTDIQEGALDICRREGYHLLIHPCRPDAPDFLEEALGLYSQSTVDGYILSQPVSEHTGLTAALREADAHVVRISNQRREHSPCVAVDDKQSAEAVIRHLVQLGHRRIGFIMGHPEHGSSHDRLEGYKEAVTKAGLPVLDELIETGRYDFESGYACAHRLLSLETRPTAIFASNDHMAVAVLTAAHEKKLDIPGDLSVCGFDDTPMARYAWPPLTTVRQPVKQAARLATSILIDMIKKKEGITNEVTLHSELVRRASTGPVPSKVTV
ncbi:MAG: LacI family DNA-binding transcriptional regulator [Acidobacteriota bacterium]|nr:LacI family DNA-binding transcriptional regulator [Acidobacteriota bacterium]